MKVAEVADQQKNLKELDQEVKYPKARLPHPACTLWWVVKDPKAVLSHPGYSCIYIAVGFKRP